MSHPGGWQQEQLFNSAEAFFSALLANLSRASRSILLETYIFNFDNIGQRIINELIQAHDRGVEIRILMDAVGSYQSGSEAAEALERAGIEVKIYHPLPWQIHHYQRAATHQGNFAERFLHFLSRINQRDHRKLCIIDERDLWTGSFNISDTHFDLPNHGDGWRDYGIHAEGQLTTEIASHFNSLWYRQTQQREQGLFHYYFQNYDLWSRRRKNQLLKRRIRNATNKIWIASAYFAPSSAVIKALKQARKRGVEVKILVPSHSDVGFFPFLTATYYTDLLSDGIQIYEYQPSVLHAKALIIDDLCLIGSTNFNHRSFLHDLELDIRLSKETSKNQLETFFKDDIAQSTEIKSGSTGGRGLGGKLLGATARILRYWM